MKLYREKFGIVDIDNNICLMDVNDPRRISIDSGKEADSEDETEDERKKWLTHLCYDPKSVAE